MSLARRATLCAPGQRFLSVVAKRADGLAYVSAAALAARSSSARSSSCVDRSYSILTSRAYVTLYQRRAESFSLSWADSGRHLGRYVWSLMRIKHLRTDHVQYKCTSARAAPRSLHVLHSTAESVRPK